MNPQPDPAVGNFFAVIFVIWFVLTFRFGWNRGPVEKESGSDWSMFKLGEIYEEENPVTQVCSTQTVKVKQTKPKKQPKHPLYDDCVDALSSLGYKKNESKKAVTNTLAKINPSTVEQFLGAFFRKKS